jgi:hypothetical protein
MADSGDLGSFAWPDRERSAEIERAADRAAERGLERLRERRRRPRALTPPKPAPHRGFLKPPAPAQQGPVAPDPWEAEFDELAEDLIAELRRDLGPADGR